MLSGVQLDLDTGLGSSALRAVATEKQSTKTARNIVASDSGSNSHPKTLEFASLNAAVSDKQKLTNLCVKDDDMTLRGLVDVLNFLSNN